MTSGKKLDPGVKTVCRTLVKAAAASSPSPTKKKRKIGAILEGLLVMGELVRADLASNQATSKAEAVEAQVDLIDPES